MKAPSFVSIEIAIIASTLTVLALIVTSTLAIEARYANKADTTTQIAGNTLLILYTQLDRANEQKRAILDRGHRVPQSLIEQIKRLCREIEKRGGTC